MIDLSWKRTASALFRLISRHPFLIIAAALVLAFLSLAYTRGHLEFWTERNVLLSQKSPSTIRYKTYRREFPDDYLIIVLESKDLEASKRFASLLGERLENDPVPVKQVFYRIPPESFQRQALLFLEPEEIRDLRSKIEKHQELLHGLASSPDLVNLLRTVNRRISRALVKTAVSGLFAEEKEEETEEEADRVDPEDLRFLSSLMDSLTLWLTDAPRYLSPWGVFLQGGGGMSDDGYLVDEEQGWVFLLAYLRDVEGSFNREGAAIDRIEEHIREVSHKEPNVTVGITGTPALNSEEMASSLKDMTRAMVLALLLVTLVFVLGFGEARRPLTAVLVLAVGIVWSLGWLSLTVGHLTILSMAFGSILIGLGIDFGIHMVARYEKERRHGIGPEPSMEASIKRVGRAILSGGLTTAAAFLALGFSRFRGIKEFGWIAGWGVVFCLFAALLVLPSALLLMDRAKGKGKHTDQGKTQDKGTEGRGRVHGEGEGSGREPRLEQILGWPARHPKGTLLVAACLTLIAFLSWEKVRFDYNLLHLQPKGTEAVAWEKRLLDAQGNSSVFAADMVDSLEEARQRVERYRSLSLVSKVESLASYLPEDPEERMQEIRRMRPLLEAVELAEGSRPLSSLKRVLGWISKIRFKLREEEAEESTPDSEGGKEGVPPPDTIAGASFRVDRVFRLLKEESGPETASLLGTYQERLFSDFRRKIEILLASLDPLPITLEGLPAMLKKRLLGTTGKWLIQVYPKENVWELEPQRPFIEQLRTVSTEITGPAVVNYESTKSLLDAYLQGGLYAVCAILIILFMDFRHPLLVLLALIPLMMAGLWTLLGMRIFDIAFNPANLVIIPLLVGIGVDNGIHVVRHFLGGDSPEEEVAGSSTGRAITLSTLTTMAGFGSLMMARHQGIFSIGALLTLAMGSCLVASLAVLPSVMRILPSQTRRKMWKKGQASSETRLR